MTQRGHERYLESIAGATTNKTLKAAVVPVLAARGFERWIYAADNPYGVVGLPIILANGLGMWLLTYMAKGYQAVDPVVVHCRSKDTPFFWDPLQGWGDTQTKVHSLMHDLGAQGFGSGMAIPLCTEDGSRGLINVIRSGSLAIERAHFEEALPCVRQVGQAMHETMIRLMKSAAT